MLNPANPAKRVLNNFWEGLKEVLLRTDTRYSEVSTGLLLVVAGASGLQPPANIIPSLLNVGILGCIMVVGLLRIYAAAMGSQALRSLSGYAATGLFVWGGLLGLNHITVALVIYTVWAFVVALSAFRAGRAT